MFFQALINFNERIRNAFNNFFQIVSPDDIIDVPMNFFFDVILNKLTKVFLRAFWFFCVYIFGCGFIIVFTLMIASADTDTTTGAILFILSDAILILGFITLIRYCLFVTPFYSEVASKISKFSFRKALNKYGEAPLLIITLVLFCYFLFVLWNTPENPNDNEAIWLLVCLLLMWFFWFMSSYKESAQIFFVAVFFVIPFMYWWVINNPEMFPNSPLLEQANVELSSQSESKSSLRKYLESKGLRVCQNDCYDLDNPVQVRYTIYMPEEASVQVQQTRYARVATRVLKSGARSLAKSLTRSLKSMLKSSAKVVTKPIVRAVVPAKKAIARVLAKPISRVKASLTKAGSKLGHVKVRLSSTVNEVKKGMQLQSRRFAQIRQQAANRFKAAKNRLESGFRRAQQRSSQSWAKAKYRWSNRFGTQSTSKVVSARDANALEMTKLTSGSGAKAVKASSLFTYNPEIPKRDTPIKSLNYHYLKHRREFIDSKGNLIYKSANSYLKGAQSFLNSPPKGTLTKVRAGNEDIVRFNEATGEYAVMTKKGAIKTYMKAQPFHKQNAPHGYREDKFKDAKEYFYEN